MRILSKLSIASTLSLMVGSSVLAQNSFQTNTQYHSANINNAAPNTATVDPNNTFQDTIPANNEAISQSTEATASTARKKMPLTVTPDNVQWKDAPNNLPAGAQIAILEGNPKARGMVTVRIKVPANYQVPPAFAQKHQRITVLSGTVNYGIGDKFDTASGRSLPAGSYVVIPAGQHHYVWATENAVIQLSGLGPWKLTYVNPSDDPRRAAKTATQAQQPNAAASNNTQPVADTY